MKKVAFVISLLSTFLLFSCASKNAAERDSLIEAPDSSENIESVEQSVNEPELSTQTESETLNTNEIESETGEESENIDTDNFTNDFNPEEQELEEIEEPEIIELEPPVEISDEEQLSEEETQNSEAENNIEQVSEEDLITPEITSEIDENSENEDVIEDDIIIIETQDNDEVENLLEESKDSIEVIEDDENEGPDPEESKLIIPSRSMTVKRLEYIDITYPGKGWVFMGLTDNSKNLTYLGRKIGTNDTKFTLQARNSGTYTLHFYKNDSVTNEYLDDYLEIIILDEKNSDKTHVEAPKYVPLLPEKKKAYIEKLNAEKAAAESKEQENMEVVPVKTAAPVKAEEQPVITPVEKKEQIPNTQIPVIEEPISAKESTSTQVEENIPDPIIIYEEALTAFKNNELKTAEQKLLSGIEYATTNKDKYLYLLGQIYEKESPIQNINKAIEEYTLLINNYPASSYWEKANKRIIYLKRFYIEGR